MFQSSKWPYFAAHPSSSLFRIFAMRNSVVKAENFEYDFEINAASETRKI